ncbi:hypothetical protein ACGFJ5_27510, partial [Micromonospora echinaurantiaca]|uniref:hypothetical protein n=1 Tax=Micromonospora echinaurantiaca TaxID=47857 RepID=UPI003713D525
QQKLLLNNHPSNKMLPKESQPEDPEESTSPGYKSNWHWLIKHPVEFSKNNHTPSGFPIFGTPSGATSLTYPGRSAPSTSGLR